MGEGKIVYRGGSRTNQALTPRPGADTTAPEGQTPGLSVFESMSGERKKAQKLDVSRLRPPLAYVADDVTKGGIPGHGVIVPVDADGNVDQTALDEWASHREQQTDVPHPFTQIVIDAITESDVKASAS